MKNIIFIAPPAAGKGTISDFLVKNYDYVHISTCDLLRDEIASGSLFGIWFYRSKGQASNFLSGDNMKSAEERKNMMKMLCVRHMGRE